jgi:hypothetical protein
MRLDNYFENHSGLGVLSTADKEGRVNAALYARPHIEDNKAVFLAAPNQTLQNVRENAYAHYLFKQDGQGYEGVRLQLRLLRIDENQDRVDALRRRHKEENNYAYILEFDIINTHTLVGKEPLS